MFRSLTRLAFVLLVVIAMNAESQAQPADTNYDESKVPDYVLPELWPRGLPRAEALDYWKRLRRAEVLDLFAKSVYGKTRQQPVRISARLVEESDDALGGIAIRRQFELTITPDAPGLDASRKLAVQVLVYAPKNSDNKTPAFLGLNFFGNQSTNVDPAIVMPTQWMRSNDEIGVVDHKATEKTRGSMSRRWPAELIVSRGYALVTAYYGDFDPDDYAGDFSDGAHALFLAKGQTAPADDEWGAIGAWAWGLSRVRDWLETDDQVNGVVDARRVAVVGHSRLGKAALWAGAQDENFALVISNDSGCGGAALFRRCFGERIHHMQRSFACWFCKNHARFAQQEELLPIDQHMLLALIAPRPLYVASASEDRWADPQGEFLSAVNAGPAYVLWNLPGLPTDEMPPVNTPLQGGRIGYHLRQGPHDIIEYDWQQFLDFADANLLKFP